MCVGVRNFGSYLEKLLRFVWEGKSHFNELAFRGLIVLKKTGKGVIAEMRDIV